MSHTPGPWAIDWNVSRIDVFSGDAGTLVASLRRSALSAGIDDTAKANARLIAAAPTLADALLNLLSALGQHEQPADVAAACEAASTALIKSGRVMG